MNEGLKTWLEREIEKNYFNFLFVKERGEELRRDDIVRLESLTECLVIVNEAEKELKDKSFEAVGDFKRKVVDLKNIDEVFNGKAKNGLQEHKNGKEETLSKSVSYADTPNTPADINLSDKIFQEYCKDDYSNGEIIYKDDVKEFIRRLKEECDKNDGYVDIDFINKLAGDKLI